MQFNEFQRRIEDAGFNERAKYILSHMFEVQAELNKQLDQAVNMILALTAAVQRFTDLHEATQQKVKQLAEFGRTSGVEVHSVRSDPDDRDN